MKKQTAVEWLPIDTEKYPYHGICGKCGNYAHKLDKDCLCQICYRFGVRKLGGMIPDEIFQFVKLRFIETNETYGGDK
jgi:hypothetical protein